MPQTCLPGPPASTCAPSSMRTGAAGSAVGVWTPPPDLRAPPGNPGRRRSPGNGLESFPSIPSVQPVCFQVNQVLLLGEVSLLRTQTFPKKEHRILHLFVTKYLGTLLMIRRKKVTQSN